MPTGQPQQRIGDVGPSAIVAQGENLVVNVSSGDRFAARCIPVPSEQAPSDYVDRPELTGPLLASLLGNEPVPKGRAIISAVHGLGGIGKTTVARWLVWQPDIEQRFCDGRIWVTLGGEGDAPDAITVITDCTSQLDPSLKTKATIEAARSDLAALLQDRSVLVVIDDVWPGKSAEVAKALMVPSPCSRFLLTTRFPQLADDPDIRAEDFPLDEMSVDQAVELIARALGRELGVTEQSHAKRLCEIVGGHPLALELAAARIKEGRPWTALSNDLSAEIARLEGLEETDDDLIAEPVDSETRKRRTSVRASLLLSVRYLNRPGQRLFAWLGVIAEEAIITPRMGATLWTVEEDTARRHLRTLSGLGLLSSKGDGYSIHDLMLDLARELVTAPETAARVGDIPGFGQTLQDANRQLLESYRSKATHDLWHTLPDDGYIHDHLLRHFEQAGWETQIKNLLWEESTDKHCGWYQAREHLGQTAGFLGDVGRVWSFADRFAAAAAGEGLRAEAIALQLHCALIIASINSLSAGIPVDVLLGAVRCRLLPLPSAVALALQHPKLQSRFSILFALERETQWPYWPRVLEETLNAARSIDDAESRARALAEAAQRLPTQEQPKVLAEALTAARGIDQEGSRARALAGIAQRRPAEEALGIARGIDDLETRAQALAEVAMRLPPEALSGVLGEALSAARGIDHAGSRARALSSVARELPAEERTGALQEALSAARGIIDARTRSRALEEVAQRLPAEEALAVARGIDDAVAHARALAEVAPRLQVGEALAVARDIADAGLRARALARVAQRLPTQEQPKVLTEALTAARGIDQEGSRARALAEVAPRLQAEEALAVARSIDVPRSRARALAEVAQRLPTEEQPRVLAEALTAARSIDDAGACAQALMEVAQMVPANEQPGVIGEALNTARSIGDAMSRALALAEVAKRLPADEALAIARGIDDTKTRAHALAEVARRLPPDALPRVLGEAFHAACGVDYDGSLTRALAQIALQLPATETLAVLRFIDDRGARARALAEVASRLAAEDQPGVLGEALSVARSIDDVGTRVPVLVEVARRLPEDDQRGVLREALSAARGSGNALRLNQALVEIAEGLPTEEALAIARGIINEPFLRAHALEKICERLPAEQALALVRGIDGASLRSEALAKIAQRLSAAEALAVARGIDDAGLRARTLAEVAQQLPEQDELRVLHEAISAARGIGDASRRTRALVEITQRLSIEGALAVARGTDDAGACALVLAEVAERLPAEDQPGVLGEALSAARSVEGVGARARVLAEIAERLPAEDQPGVFGEALDSTRAADRVGLRAQALAEITQRLPAEEGLVVACGIDDGGLRARALKDIAQRLDPGQMVESSLDQWVEAARVLATNGRSQCIADFAAMLPIIRALGGEYAARSLARSIGKVGTWWP